jgi:hypothetical protein
MGLHEPVIINGGCLIYLIPQALTAENCYSLCACDCKWTNHPRLFRVTSEPVLAKTPYLMVERYQVIRCYFIRPRSRKHGCSVCGIPRPGVLTVRYARTKGLSIRHMDTCTCNLFCNISYLHTYTVTVLKK